MPVSPNSKPKQTPEFKIERLLQSTSEPSTMAADFFHMVRRFVAGKTAGNRAEEVIFNIFQSFSPKSHEILVCTLQEFDSLSPEIRDQLFNPDFLRDINLANNPVKLRNAIAQEVLDYTTSGVFDSNKCTNEERSGLVRTQPFPGGEFPPSQVRICRINGLRTLQFVPHLTAGEYTTAEVQQICHMETDANGIDQLVCETQTTNCVPGTEFAGICLRLYEIEIGGNVVLEGMNFSSIDTKVQLTDMNENTRQVDAFVCGDEDTPLTEIINGTEVPIIDCRVHDRLTFRVPEDMAPGQYYLQVIVPNPNQVGGWNDPLTSSSITVQIVLPSSAQFEITAESLRCIDETHIDWLGSDEVGIKIRAFTILPNLTVSNLQALVDIEFDDVDSGDNRTVEKLFFSNNYQIAGVGAIIRGWEIDGTDEYADVNDDFNNAVNALMKQTIIYYNEAETLCTSGINTDDLDNPRLYAEWKNDSEGNSWLVDILLLYLLIKGIYKLIDYIRGISAPWGPADPIIDDIISLTTLDLLHLTSTAIAYPQPYEYDVNGIKVKVTPIAKSYNQYREKREYKSDDEGSHYEIVLRYNRIS